jgi:hypothetical protein
MKSTLVVEDDIKHITDFAWSVMCNAASESDDYKSAERIFDRFADEAVRGDRPVKIEVKYV